MWVLSPFKEGRVLSPSFHRAPGNTRAIWMHCDIPCKQVPNKTLLSTKSSELYPNRCREVMKTGSLLVRTCTHSISQHKESSPSKHHLLPRRLSRHSSWCSGNPSKSTTGKNQNEILMLNLCFIEFDCLFPMLEKTTQ